MNIDKIIEEFENEFCTVPDLDEDTGKLINWKASSFTRATDVRDFLKQKLLEVRSATIEYFCSCSKRFEEVFSEFDV